MDKALKFILGLSLSIVALSFAGMTAAITFKVIKLMVEVL